MLDKINKKALMLYLYIQSALGRLREEESGMEVMQIVLLLGVGIGIIVLLITFGGRITDRVGQLVDDVLGKM